MGCKASTTKSDSIRQLSTLKRSWITDVNEITELVIRSINNKCLRLEGVVIKLNRLENHGLKLKRILLQNLPENSEYHQLLLNNINKVPMLEEKNYLLEQEIAHLREEHGKIVAMCNEAYNVQINLTNNEKQLNLSPVLQINCLIQENARLRQSQQSSCSPDMQLLETKYNLIQLHLDQQSESEKLRKNYETNIYAYQAELARLENMLSQSNNCYPAEQQRTSTNETRHAEEIKKCRLQNCLSETLQGNEIHEKINETEQNAEYVIESLKIISQICEKSKELESKIETFSGRNEDKDYLHMKELLIRSLLKLDNVQTEDHVIIRNKRKEAIKFVHKLLDDLNNKVQ